MKFKDSDFEIITQGPGYLGGLKMIETVGRTCYQSQRKQTEDSCYGFVDRMKSSEHYAMLEFFTVYLKIQNTDPKFYKSLKFYESNPYSKVNMDTFEKTLWITTNYRVLIENKRESDLDYLCIPELEHAKRTTIRLFISRGISHECVRHRVASFAQSSQRYINYSKQHFGGEIIFIIPDKFYRLRDEYAETVDSLTGESRGYLKNLHGEELVNALICIDRGAACWYDNMVRTEEDYKYLTLEEGWAAQDARDVLNNATSTILNICMFDEDWKHYLDLRSLGTTGKPHPDMKRISDRVLDKMIKDGIFKLDEEGKLCLC